jgi:hypothetical protein
MKMAGHIREATVIQGPDVARDLRNRCAAQKIPWPVYQSTQGFWCAAVFSLAKLRSASARAALARALSSIKAVKEKTLLLWLEFFLPSNPPR